MKRTLVICDPETEYTKRLMEFMNRKKSLHLTAAAFDSFEPAARFIGNNGAEMLLISERFLCERVNELKVKKVIVLTEDEDVNIPEHQCICKYLPADRIMREAESAYDAEMRALGGMCGPGGFGSHASGRLYSVYSPVGGSGKTSFALTLGFELARAHRVLYMNMECCSALPVILGVENERNISDLVYLARQDPEAMIRRFPEMTVSIRNLDCIMPAGSFEDISSTGPAEWTRILERILEESIYDIILVEPADSMQGFLNILKCSTGIFMPLRPDAISMAKIDGYERMMAGCGAAEIPEKTYKVRVPFFNTAGIGRSYYESLPWSELGDCVRRLIRKENIA